MISVKFQLQTQQSVFCLGFLLGGPPSSLYPLRLALVLRMDSYLKDAVVLVSPCLQRLGTQHDNTVGLSNVIGICGDHLYKWPKWQHVADKRGFCAQLVRKIQEKNCAHYMVLWRCLAYMPVYCLKLFMIYNIISDIYIYICIFYCT